MVSPREERLQGDNRARVGGADARYSLIATPAPTVYHLNQAEMISQQWGLKMHMVNKASLDARLCLITRPGRGMISNMAWWLRLRITCLASCESERPRSLLPCENQGTCCKLAHFRPSQHVGRL